jgi:4'-phosphopantetheinyl transferase
MDSHSISNRTGTALGPTVASVWIVRLDVPEREVRSATLLLAPEERERAGAFQNDVARRRHVLARAALRRILAARLKVAPAELRFRNGPNGKPVLQAPSDVPLDFNISHSHNLALVAVSDVGSIGIDVERLRPMPDVQRIADRFFTPDEAASLRSLPEVDRSRGFFKLWARKEALAKATGRGILQAASAQEFGRDNLLASWSLHEFEPAPAYVAAVALQKPGAQFIILTLGPALAP